MTETYKNRDWLYEQYVENGLTQSEMAEKAGCGQHTISRWLRKHDITTRRAEDYITHPYVGEHPKGYFEARCQHNGSSDRFYIHRLVAVAKYGFDEVCGMDVHHKNGFGLDNRPSNLELKDPSDHSREHRLMEVENGKKLEERFNE